MLIRRSSLKPIEFGRLRIYDYTAAEQWSSSVAVVEVPPGARHSEAWSKRSDKYYLVTQGRVRFVLEGKVAVMGPGDFCFVRCGRRFSYSNEQTETATLVLAHTPSFRLEDDVFVE